MRFKKNGYLTGKKKRLKTKKTLTCGSVILTSTGNTRKFQWIKGHNAHPQNERCDHLAEKAAKQSPVNVDAFYEKNQNKSDPFYPYDNS